ELLPQELFPQIVYPQLTVVTPYENAAPEEIETLITKPIEEAVGTVAGVKRISSISKEGLSLVIAEFGWNQNINFASLGMREKIDLIKERLPREAEEPTVLPFNPFDRPILLLSVTSSTSRAPMSLREIVRRMIKDEIEKVEGVASANISGGVEREIQIEVNQDELQTRRISLLDVSKAISNANLNYPAGTIKESFYEYLIRTLGEFEQVRDLETVSIGSEKSREEAYREERERDTLKRRGLISKDKRLIYLKDVAKIYDDQKERTSFSRYNGKENISVAVQKQALGNTVKIINNVKKKIIELKQDLPKDIKMEIVYDQSEFIKSSISGVWNAAWQGGVLVFLVLFYFLRNVWSALIVTMTIPISVMATFALMYFSGISLNMMSLGGLAFGVGSLVDCAIVVVENIFRHMQMGEEKKSAAIMGANEVFISVTGSILTTVVVFLPLIFVVGIIGQISKDFALTVTFSLLASLLASITIIPLLASRALSADKSNIPADENDLTKIDKIALLAKVRRSFEGLLDKFINAKARYLVLTFVVFLLSLTLFIVMDKELMPKVDQGQFIIKVDMPAGTRLDVTNSVSERIENFIMKIPEVLSVNTTVGSTRETTIRDITERLAANQAEIAVTLRKKRKLKSSDVVQIIKDRFAKMNLEDAKIEYVLQENVLATGMQVQAPVTIEIKGDSLATLERLTFAAQRGLSAINGIYGVKNDLAEPSPETKVFIDKDKAAIYGLSVTDIAQTALIALKGHVATKFKEKGQEYDIRVRLRNADRDNFEKLGRIEIESPYGFGVPLSSVASFGKGKGPSEIKRINQERVITVYANIYNRPLKDVMADVNDMIKRMSIPKGYIVKIAGESEEMKASFISLRNAIIAAFLLVYMIMAAIFESLWQPFIIMFTIPLSLIGVAWALLITRTSVSAYVLMGVGILGGIVVNNAIVLIDCINLFISKGMSVKDAVVNASKVRLRPILMTALTTILGLVPMAFLGGEGAELRAPMAITVMGGLLVSTYLTLIVIPSLYLSVAGARDKILSAFSRKKPEKPVDVPLPVVPITPPSEETPSEELSFRPPPPEPPPIIEEPPKPSRSMGAKRRKPKKPTPKRKVKKRG
ncbi:MAG: efflux RND transporter permease subunit, partial [Candidatus Omnitrophica bacterium]|nr:efflux RND transporter permease subunit [Candidatus Omnitrophota bacterium]